MRRPKTLPAICSLAIVYLFISQMPVYSQVVVALAPVAAQQFFSVSGSPLATACVNTYVTGTSTPLAAYSDSTGTQQLSNPIILDAGGRASIWLSNATYRFSVVAYDGIPGNKCAAGVTQYTIDGINAFAPIANAANLFLAGQASDPSGTAGEMIYRTDIPCFRFFTTLWDCVVRLTDTQTLTNKTLTAPIINGASTGTGIQGSDTKILSSGTVSASSGVTLCTDANGGATTSNCGAGVAKFDQLNNTASIPTTTLYAVPSNGAGTYRLNCFAIVTQAATTSSTLPGCSMNWTDQDTSVVVGANNTVASTANQVGTNTPIATAPTLFFEVKASTNITFNFSGYVSSGATPMAYAAHVKLEYLGP